nr:hypothetical protein [Tanacetum cinerariifolium]
MGSNGNSDKREGKIGMINVDDLRAIKPNGEKLFRDITERMNMLTDKGGVAVSHQRMPIRVLNNPNSTIYESSMERDDSKCFIGTVLSQRSQTDGQKDANDNPYGNLDINVSHMPNVLDRFFGIGSSLGNRNVKFPDGTQSNSQSTIFEYPNAEPIVNESSNTSDFIPNSLQSVRDLQLGKHEIWPLLSKEKGQEITYIVCNRYVILSESVSMLNATRVNLVEFGVTCNGSPKVSTFGVPLSTVGDLHKFINDIEFSKHDELLFGMTNEDYTKTMDALGTICNSIQADNNNADVIPFDINTKSTSYAGAVGASGKDQPKVNSNFRTLVADLVFDGINIYIPCTVVKKVSTRFKHNLYGYIIGFLFFKFDSRVGLEAVLVGGPWLIRKSLIILKKWPMDSRLLKEELTRNLIWANLHDVPIQVFKEDGISLIATFIGKPIMLDSYTSSMCNDSWGRISFARCLIELNLEAHLMDVVTIGMPSLFGDGFTKETIMLSMNRGCLYVIYTNNDFQTVGKKKRKGKSKSTYGVQFASPSVKQNVIYEPKATASAPKKGVTNVEDVENVYDESANLIHNIKAGGSSSFTVAADRSPWNENLLFTNRMVSDRRVPPVAFRELPNIGGPTDCIMVDPILPDHITASLNHAPPPPQQDIEMIDVATETTTPKAVASHVMRLRFRAVGLAQVGAAGLAGARAVVRTRGVVGGNVALEVQELSKDRPSIQRLQE